MTIQLNGKTVTLPQEVTTVHDLLSHYQIENRIVIVELNKEIPGKEQYETLLLNEGDRVEMIHFVGGG
ncbi:sulfur carrier protein ThiS [Mesobacillus foraminis]|uniref:sulfur carrier protein ThiS n=1 Tax=Mesobacillus foraminis TaxID=279826 RepID=UPI001BE7B479|nr:sulfur carrier protein ThiS [Mesobacillus foraminis]MBT2755239.1 sulfur carrier protein ThiS [Mesobacillus foraminis]